MNEYNESMIIGYVIRNNWDLIEILSIYLVHSVIDSLNAQGKFEIKETNKNTSSIRDWTRVS